MNNFRKSVIYQIFKKIESKISTIYVIILVLLVLIAVVYFLNNSMIHKKLKNIENMHNQQNEHFKNQNKNNIKTNKYNDSKYNVITNNKYNKKQNGINVILNANEFKKILQLNRELDKQNKSNIDEDYKKLIKQKQSNNKKHKHPNKSDNTIEYYTNKSDCNDKYLNFFSKLYNKYDKKPKNKMPFIGNKNQKVPFASLQSLDNINEGDLLDKGNLTNVKEKNYGKLKLSDDTFQELPLRKDLDSCFKCQRNYLICNDAHVPKDQSQGNKFDDKPDKKIRELETNEKLDYKIKVKDDKPLVIKDKYIKPKQPKLYDNEIDNIIKYNKINYLKY